eukprot:5752350-Alexandrium_andersonii.AAC.1
MRELYTRDSTNGERRARTMFAKCTCLSAPSSHHTRCGGPGIRTQGPGCPAAALWVHALKCA